MSAVLKQPGPLSAQAFEGLVMTPRSDGNRNGGVSERALAGFATMEALYEPEPPCLTLDERELAEIKLRSDALAAAADEAREADQRLAAAETQARRISMLEGQSGLAAARAISGGDVERAALARLNAELEEARHAQGQVKMLRALADEAGLQKDRAYGALRVTVNTCLANLRARASAEFSRLAEAMLVTIATIDATVMVQPMAGEAVAAGWSIFKAHLNVPALPEPLRQPNDRAIEELQYRSTLLAASHSRLSARELKCKSDLLEQVADALASAGLRPHNIL